MFIFYKSFNLLCSWKYLINEILCWNLFNFRKLLRTYSNILFHLSKNIICTNHSSCSTFIWEQYIIYSNIIQISKSSLQWIHISKFCNGLLCILKHFLCKNSLWSFIVARCCNLFILLNCCVKIHILTYIDKKCSNRMISNSTDSHTCCYRLLPSI